MKFLFNKKEIYKDKYYIYYYNDNTFRIVCNKYTKEKGFEEVKNYIDFLGDEEETKRTSLSRTKRNIREIALCNNFTHFATLTVSDQNKRYSLEKVQAQLKYIIQEKIRRKNKDFRYIFITEKHKDGAYHFHGLVSDLPLYTNNNGYLSNKAFDCLGFNSFSVIKDYNKCCNYITKYITKDCVKNSSNQIYISSRGLKKAEKYEIKPISIDWKYENDFCKVADYNYNELTPQQKLIFLQNIEEFLN